MNKHAQALGRIKTAKKARSSRENGRLGGRPIGNNLDKKLRNVVTINILDKNQAIG